MHIQKSNKLVYDKANIVCNPIRYAKYCMNLKLILTDANPKPNSNSCIIFVNLIYSASENANLKESVTARRSAPVMTLIRQYGSITAGLLGMKVNPSSLTTPFTTQQIYLLQRQNRY